MALVQGVLEAIRISCAGYPTKRTFDEFLDRFGLLAPDILDGYKLTGIDLIWFSICQFYLLYVEMKLGPLGQDWDDSVCMKLRP